MNTWTRRIIVPALLATSAATFGCTTTVNDEEEGGGPQGAGASGSGAGGTGNGIGGTGNGGASTDPTVCVPGVPATSQLPRLTRAQYDNTVRDLVGIDNQPSSMLAPDSIGSVGQQAWDGYQTAAATVAAAVIADSAARAKAIPCTPDGDGAACATELVDTLGPRAFRRPLTDAEKARYRDLYTRRAELTETGTFDEGAQLIIEAFLLSPSFLMRAEIDETPDGNLFVLSNHEVASRLSYMLWESMPDDELFAAANAGELSTTEQILAQAERMLADPKSHAMVRAFHQQYLKMGPNTRWADIQRDPSLFPDFNADLVPLLSEETDRFVEHVVFDQAGSFQDLVNTPVAFVNASLAPIYDLDPAHYPGTELVAADVDPTTRAGLFTRLGFLTANSGYDRTSPILRGAFLQKEILCTDIPPPPAMAEGTALPTDPGLKTNRARVDAQTAPDECSFCHHSYINPTGFTMEAYDAIGAYQTTESFSGEPLDTTATVDIGGEPVDVAGPVELSAAIAAAPEAHACYARKWVKYAYQRDPNNEDSCLVDEMTAKLGNGDYTVLDLIADLTQSQSFRTRALQAEVAP
jgi:hypothetical protein